MKLINNNIIEFTLEERGEVGLYDVEMYLNKVPYIGVYSYCAGFIHSSLEDKEILAVMANEIKKVLENKS